MDAGHRRYFAIAAALLFALNALGQGIVYGPFTTNQVPTGAVGTLTGGTFNGTFNGAFNGNGAGLTNISGATGLTNTFDANFTILQGTNVHLASGPIITNTDLAGTTTASSIVASNSVIATNGFAAAGGAFSGNGSGLTNIPPSGITNLAPAANFAASTNASITGGLIGVNQTNGFLWHFGGAGQFPFVIQGSGTNDLNQSFWGWDSNANFTFYNGSQGLVAQITNGGALFGSNVVANEFFGSGAGLTGLPTSSQGVNRVYTSTNTWGITNSTSTINLFGTNNGIGTLTLTPAQMTAGTDIRIEMRGPYNESLGNTLNYAILLGTTTIYTNTWTTGTVTASPFFDSYLDITFRGSGTSGACIVQGVNQIVAVSALTIQGVQTSINTTSSKNLAILLSWNTAQANDQFTVDIAKVTISQ